MFKIVAIFVLYVSVYRYGYVLAEGSFDCSHQAVTNPEKGSYGWCDLTHSSNDYSNYGLDTGTDSYGDAYRYEYTLCYGQIVLSSFLTSSIDASTLSLVDQHLGELTVAGVKPIVRIMYATNIGENDTSLTWVETHLQQLQPVFEKHSAIIAWFQGGIIGAWGEWHSSSSGLDTAENKVAVFDLLHTYLPVCKKVQVRYPMIMPSLVTNLIASEDEAFDAESCTKAHRLGFHNDCWMSSWHDTGTYEYQGAYNQAAREHWLPYVENVTRYSPYGGETCIDSTTGSVWTEFSCSFIFQEAQQLHATFLNPTWHPEVTKHMKDNCCWEEFIDRSGYRFELLNASIPATAALGTSLSYELDIANTGWSSLYSQRRGYLSLFQYLMRGDMTTVTVDGDWEQEWSGVTSGFTDEFTPGTAAVADVREVRVTNDADFVYILIRFYNVTDGNDPFSAGYFHLLFDTDNSAGSGYLAGVGGGQIGSELLLSGSSFYDQRSGGFNEGSVSGGLTKEISPDGLTVEMKVDRHLQYSDTSSVFPADGNSFTILVVISDTSWNFVEFAPKTLGGYEYEVRNAEDVITRYDHDLGEDLRRWRGENGAVHISGSLTLPSDFVVSGQGDSQENVMVGLWFPDPSAELRNHTRLSIQLGSTLSGGVWDSARGVNMLPLEVNVTAPSPASCFPITTVQY